MKKLSLVALFIAMVAYVGAAWATQVLPPGVPGQLITNAGNNQYGATGPGGGAGSFSLAGSMHQWSGLYVVGDNLSNFSLLNPTNNGWGYLTASQMGTGPTLKIDAVNNAYLCDIINAEMVTLQQPTTSSNIPLALMGSVNDATWGNHFITNHVIDNKSCLMGGLTWVTVPVDYKTYAQALSNVTTSGAWTKDSSYGGAFGYTTDEQGDSMSLTTTTNGGPIYLWYQMNANNGGTFTANVDGALSSTTTVLTQGTNSISFCGSACGQSLGAVRLATTTTGSHTVNINVLSATTTTNTVTIEGIGTPPGKPYSSKFPVAVVAGSPYTSSSFSSEAGTFSAAYQGVASQLLADGLGTLFANINNYFNVATDVTAFVGGGTTVNAQGQRHYADAFTGILQPIRSADGSIDPRDYGAACNAQWYGFSQEAAGTEMYWGVNTTANSPVISLSAQISPFPLHYFQPGVATQNGGGDVGKRACIFGGDQGNVGPCTYIKSVNTATNQVTLGANMAVTLTGGSGRSLVLGGYPSNPNDPSTAQDDSPFLAEASQAAILGGGKVHLPTNCMGHSAQSAANVLWEGNNAGRFYHGGSQHSINSSNPPPVATIFYCGTTGYADSDPTCIDASQTPNARFSNFLIAGLTYPFIGYQGLTNVGIGYGRSSGTLGPNNKLFTDNMSYYQVPVGVGSAIGYNIPMSVSGYISGTTTGSTGNILNVLSVTTTNVSKTYTYLLAGGNGWANGDVLEVGRQISGTGVPSGETITSTPPGFGPGQYGVSLAASTSVETISATTPASGMSLVDSNSQYGDGISIGVNSDLTDSHFKGSIFSGSFIYYGIYQGPYTGTSYGNGGTSVVDGRFEEVGLSAVTLDLGGGYFSGVDFDFNGGFNIQLKGVNSNPLFGPNAQVTGGWMNAGGHCAGFRNAMVDIGGEFPSISIDGTEINNNDAGSCGGSGFTNYLFSTSTGAGINGSVTASITGGLTDQPGVFKITNLFDFTNGFGGGLFYRQDSAGFPVIDTSQRYAISGALALTSTHGGAAYVTGLSSTTTNTGTQIISSLKPVINLYDCSGGDFTTGLGFSKSLTSTTSTACALNITTTVTSGDTVWFKSGSGN